MLSELPYLGDLLFDSCVVVCDFRWKFVIKVSLAEVYTYGEGREWERSKLGER